ncbi:hypothetical protein [Luteimonas kalidii]|uniref:Uncharacterized protein n=1 Tax=Luteimonas kalidii TaxID=3042025 RepID=A0ABT6JYD5_9GAMM|nr:hypothetical protein [Luteimonas kalidii]MDH5835171.1 hypothetical protein [Luteimonas kalidii]
MNHFAHFPARPHWTAQQLADAVPVRLHQLFAFDARHEGADAPAANAPRHRARDARYTRHSMLPPRFGVH